MILMGLVSLALFVGMPKLVENSTFLSRSPFFSSCPAHAPPHSAPFPRCHFYVGKVSWLIAHTVDPETRAEFEEQSKKNPMNSLMAGPQSGSGPMGNFDVAGFLAGQGSGSGSKDVTSETGSGNGGNGGKKGGKK